VHYDVHGGNVLRAAAGATLIDWGDAGWADPAHDFGAIPMHRVPEVLDGYEEVASMGPGPEARVLRAVIGQAVRKARGGWDGFKRDLLAFWSSEVPPRWRPWAPPRAYPSP
jgi:aminoglycoside phosphotransferase (APT) family kinase protein